MNHKTRWILVVAMAAVALAVAGVRGPNSADPTVTLAAADPKPSAKEPAAGTPTSLERKQLRTFDYIPEDAKFVIAISPSELLKSHSMQQLQKFVENTGLENKFGLPLAEIEDVKIVQTAAGNIFESGPRPPFQRLVIKAVKPHDWKKWLVDKTGVKPKQVGDKTIYELAGEGSAYVPDDRTLVVVFVQDDVEMKKIIFGAEKLHSEDMQSFPALIYSPFAVWVDTKSIKAELEKPGVPLDPTIVMIHSMLEHTNSASLWASLYTPTPNGAEERVNAGLVLNCDSNDAAKQSAALLGATRTLLQTFTSTAEKLASDSIEKLPADQRKLAEIKIGLVREASRILEKMELKSDGDKATAAADFVLPPTVISSLLEPAVIASHEAAMRAQSMNNMKQLTLAMMMYEDTHHCLPASAQQNKAGEKLLSWRVSILPFLGDEGRELFEQFHQDESWDSEHNRKLIAKMPALFRDPHDDPNSTTASYFMPTGKGTIGEIDPTPGNPRIMVGTKFMDITDGTSQTILLVEAKRDIPWTKPEDIEVDVDPAKPLPKFGGHWLPGVFGAAFADGSVHVISDATDPKVLRALFTINGGEPIDRNALDAVPSVKTTAPAATPSPVPDKRPR